MNPDYLDPPGCHVESHPHPGFPKTRSFEKAVFTQHRFAFFYWAKWTEEFQESGRGPRPPDLITIDYHPDLAAPSNQEREALMQARDFGPRELARFVWDRLHPMNNGHILDAAYLNLIGDVYLLRQGENDDCNFDDDGFLDFEGNLHKVYEYTEVEKFEADIANSTAENAYLDIDLDYFIQTEGLMYQNATWVPFTDAQIQAVVDPQRLLFQWLQSRIQGITIATEPHYCGGLLNSCHFLRMVEDQLFYQDGKAKFAV